MVFMVFLFKMIENHTYFNGFHGFWSSGHFWAEGRIDFVAKATNLRPKVSRASKTMKTIEICMVFNHFEWKNHENHWNMYDFQSFWMKKPWKPLKNVWFSISPKWNLKETLEYVWFYADAPTHPPRPHAPTHPTEAAKRRSWWGGRAYIYTWNIYIRACVYVTPTST